jgi:hypothetical protein
MRSTQSFTGRTGPALGTHEPKSGPFESAFASTMVPCNGVTSSQRHSCREVYS